MSKISVIIKEPDKRPRRVNIENSLQNLQRWVGGYIETVHLVCYDKYQRPRTIVMIVNEEGKWTDLPFNFVLQQGRFRETIVGTAIFCGQDGEDLADLPVSFQEFKGGFPELWEGL